MMTEVLLPVVSALLFIVFLPFVRFLMQERSREPVLRIHDAPLREHKADARGRPYHYLDIENVGRQGASECSATLELSLPEQDAIAVIRKTARWSSGGRVTEIHRGQSKQLLLFRQTVSDKAEIVCLGGPLVLSADEIDGARLRIRVSAVGRARPHSAEFQFERERAGLTLKPTRRAKQFCRGRQQHQ